MVWPPVPSAHKNHSVTKNDDVLGPLDLGSRNRNRHIRTLSVFKRDYLFPKRFDRSCSMEISSALDSRLLCWSNKEHHSLLSIRISALRW